MEFVVTGLCLVISGIIGVLAYAYIDNFRKADIDESTGDTSTDSSDISAPEKAEPPIAAEKPTKSVTTLFRSLKQSLTPKRLILLSVGTVVNLSTAFRLSSFDLTLTTEFKITITLALLLAALIIDWETRKIPNLLIICMIGLRLIFLIPEFLLYRDGFKTLLLGSAIGLGGCFIIMLVLSLITKGGIGMGDVKLISAVGCLSGIAASFYTLVFGMVACMVVALTLLAMKKKTMKDQVPFGPFVYFGYAAAILIGTF